MNTSKYLSEEFPNARRKVKRTLRSGPILEILDKGRKERKDLSDKLTDRNNTIKELREAIQGMVDAGTWYNKLERLGFTKKP